MSYTLPLLELSISRQPIFQRSANFLKEIFTYITKNLFYKEVSYGNSQRFLPG